MGRWWKYLAALAPAGLGLAAWGLLSSDLMISLDGPLGEAVLAAGILLTAVAMPYTLFGAGEAANAARQAQMQAEQQRRFLRNLDHELKNPLTGIQGGLDSLGEVLSDPEQQTTLGIVKNQAELLSRLVVNLRKLNQLENVPFEPEPVDVQSLLHDVSDWARQHPKAHDREFAYDAGALPPSGVGGEEDLLYLALCNLVDNAMKFTRSGDRVAMRAFQDGGHVLVEITDTGPGIPESELPYIWEPLFRGERARGMPGSGVGLALVRAIVDRQGGQIAVRSREGQGSAFTLRLPVA